MRVTSGSLSHPCSLLEAWPSATGGLVSSQQHVRFSLIQQSSHARDGANQWLAWHVLEGCVQDCVEATVCTPSLAADLNSPHSTSLHASCSTCHRRHRLSPHTSLTSPTPVWSSTEHPCMCRTCAHHPHRR